MAENSKGGLKSPFTDAVFKAKGGMASPAPVTGNKSGKK